MNGQPHHHPHPHARAHVHPHAPEVAAPPAGGMAVLDIGGDVGALVVELDARHLGTELHVRRADRPGVGTVHTGVWSRDQGGREVVVAVFPHLHEGGYDVLGPEGTPVARVDIRGGRVTEAALG